MLKTSIGPNNEWLLGKVTAKNCTWICKPFASIHNEIGMTLSQSFVAVLLQMCKPILATRYTIGMCAFVAGLPKIKENSPGADNANTRLTHPPHPPTDAHRINFTHLPGKMPIKMDQANSRFTGSKMPSMTSVSYLRQSCNHHTCCDRLIDARKGWAWLPINTRS